MRKLFHLVGRAWSFVTSHLPGEHFAINHGDVVPGWMKENAAELAKHGEVTCEIMDMDGRMFYKHAKGTDKVWPA